MKIVDRIDGDVHPWVPGVIFAREPGLLGLLGLVERLGVSCADDLRGMLKSEVSDAPPMS